MKLLLCVDTALLIKATAGWREFTSFPRMRRARTRLTRQKIRMQPQTWRDKLLWHGWAESVHEGMQQIKVGSIVAEMKFPCRLYFIFTSWLQVSTRVTEKKEAALLSM